MTRATDAYAALTAALDVDTPNCLNDHRFIDDGTRAADLEPICQTCPVFSPCELYAATAKPAAGVWAGRRWKGTANARR